MSARSIVTLVIIGALALSLVLMAKAWWGADDSLPGDRRAYELDELDVVLAVPVELNDLTHDARTVSGLGSVVSMRASTLPDASGTGCTLGILYSVDKSDIGVPGARWDQAGIERGIAGTGDTPPTVKELTDSYLIFEPSQAVCSTDEAKVEQEATKRSALWQSLQTAVER